MQSLRALIVLPTYQEAENIAEVLRRVRAAAPRADVLVIDDSSPDGTADIARAMDLELGGVSVSSVGQRSWGWGAPTEKGFAWVASCGTRPSSRWTVTCLTSPRTYPAFFAASMPGRTWLLAPATYRAGPSPTGPGTVVHFRPTATTTPPSCFASACGMPQPVFAPTGRRPRPNRHRLGPDRGVRVPGRDAHSTRSQQLTLDASAMFSLAPPPPLRLHM
jgi:hypothetical protein